MVDASGTIEAVAPGLIQIKSIAGELWLVRLTRETTVQVTGEAKADVVTVGSFVSFVADVDKRRSQVQEKVDKLTLFTPSPERQFGAFPDQGGLGADAGSGPFGADPFGGKPRVAQQPRADKDTGPPVERFEITGRISGIKKNGKIFVYAPNTYFKPAVEFELAEDPEIQLDLSGLTMYTLAKPGDKVQARGRQVGQNMVQATDLTIELAEPYTTVQPKKKPPRKATRSSRRKPDEPEEAGEAEQDVKPKEAGDADEGGVGEGAEEAAEEAKGDSPK